MERFPLGVLFVLVLLLTVTHHPPPQRLVRESLSLRLRAALRGASPPPPPHIVLFVVVIVLLAVGLVLVLWLLKQPRLLDCLFFCRGELGNKQLKSKSTTSPKYRVYNNINF